MSVHICKGEANNKIGFVLSTPGKIESEAGCPAAGDTGDNMKAILEILNLIEPKIFPSTDRYHYLITNASIKVMYASKDKGKTEDTDSSIIEQMNLDRIRREITHCEILILCGEKAHLLETHLSEKFIIKTPHLGNRGLRNRYKNDDPCLKGMGVAKDRDFVRWRLCAENILEQLRT